MLLIGIPSRDPFLVTQYLERHSVSSDQHMKKLMSLCEGLHEMMQCYRRQHFAASNDLHEHPRRHSSWREVARMKCMNIQMEYSKMRSGSSECMWKTTGAFISSWRIKTASEGYFDQRAQEVWERKWMNLDMHTTLLDMNILKAMEMILMVLREQSEENDQMNTVRTPVNLISEALREWRLALEEREGFWE